MWIQSVFCGPEKHLSEAQSPHRRRNQKPRKVFQVALTHTVPGRVRFKAEDKVRFVKIRTEDKLFFKS